MTHSRTHELLEEATDILLQMRDNADEVQQRKIQAICDEMKYSDRLDDEMRMLEEYYSEDT
jgi:hypothetical protein